MRCILSSFIVVSVLLALPVGTMALLDNGESQTYRVYVTTSFGTQFEDCYTFNSDGSLVIALGPGEQVWAGKNLGNNKYAWQSTSTFNTAFPLAFSGVKSLFGLSGDGINNIRNTFKLFGKLDKRCEVLPPAAEESLASTGNPYKQ